MTARTIDLTTLPPVVSKDLLKLDFNYQQGRSKRQKLLAQYYEQKERSDSLFFNWLKDASSQLLNEVDEFINESLGSKGGMLFPDLHSSVIHPATIVLGIQNNDHIPTLDLMEDRIKKKHKDIKVLRVDSGVTKKSQVHDLLDRVKGESRLLAIVENAEKFDKLIRSFVRNLFDMLDGRVDRRVMIIFCLSSGIKPLPCDIIHHMRKITTIEKESKDIIQAFKKNLLEASKKTSFEIGPDLRELMYEHFTTTGTSIASAKYIYQYSMFEHYLENALTPLDEEQPAKSQVCFNNADTVRDRVVASARFVALSEYTDVRSDFGLLYDIIYRSPEEINLADLYNDFKQAKEDQKQTKTPGKPTNGQKSKTPRRTTRATPGKIKKDDPDERNLNEEDGLIKAIFIDLVSCMEHQGLIKVDSRRSKKGVLRKVVWL